MRSVSVRAWRELKHVVIGDVRTVGELVQSSFPVPDGDSGFGVLGEQRRPNGVSR